ncbi:hypothetical protein BJX65DRAFT_30962 [Aspergillus insuetus]
MNNDDVLLALCVLPLPWSGSFNDSLLTPRHLDQKVICDGHSRHWPCSVILILIFVDDAKQPCSRIWMPFLMLMVAHARVSPRDSPCLVYSRHSSNPKILYRNKTSASVIQC